MITCAEVLQGLYSPFLFLIQNTAALIPVPARSSPPTRKYGQGPEGGETVVGAGVNTGSPVLPASCPAAAVIAAEVPGDGFMEGEGDREAGGEVDTALEGEGDCVREGDGAAAVVKTFTSLQGPAVPPLTALTFQ